MHVGSILDYTGCRAGARGVQVQVSLGGGGEGGVSEGAKT